jgi:hypothetical protein
MRRKNTDEFFEIFEAREAKRAKFFEINPARKASQNGIGFESPNLFILAAVAPNGFRKRAIFPVF